MSGEEFLTLAHDVSRSGISFSNFKGLEVNEAVKVGPIPGTVLRIWHGGAVIRFAEELAAEGFDVTIVFT